MRLISSIVLMLCILVTACKSEPLILQQLQDNTVVLTADDRGNHGSGFLFTRGDCQGKTVTFIWTAAHVVEDWMQDDGFCLPVPVKQGDRHGQAEVLRMSDSVLADDIALLRVVEGDFYGTSKFYRAFNETYLGQPVVLCGTPGSIRWNERVLAFGRISYFNRLAAPGPEYKLHLCDMLDLTSHGGVSGGPVIDEKTGGVLGMLVMCSGQRRAFMEPTRHIYQFAKDHDCLWAFDRSYSLPETLRAWPSDWYLAEVRERGCDLDYEWGSMVPRSKPTIAPSPIPDPPQVIEVGPDGVFIIDVPAE